MTRLGVAVLVVEADILAAPISQTSFTQIPMVVASVLALIAVGIAWQAIGLTKAASGLPGWRWLARSGEALAGFGCWCAIAGSVIVLSYICARAGQPLQDSLLAHADKTLGFDWPRWFSMIGRHPALKVVLKFAYDSLALQTFAIFFVATFAKDRKRLAELFWAATVGVLICLVICLCVPALGPRAYFDMGTDWWIADVTRLRAAGPASFTMTGLTGIVSMRSFHTFLAILFAWSSRQTGMIGWLLAALNAVMIASTLSEGGHYLVDVIAGAILAATTILAVNYSIKRR